MGHLDLIERGRALVDELIVAVAINRDKNELFTVEERLELLTKATRDMDGVRVISFSGLVVDLLERAGAQFILRGIRTFSDFEAELSMALTNRQLAAGRSVETVFVLPKMEYSHFSSRRVKEVASFGGDLTPFLPASIQPEVVARLADRLGPD